MPAADCCHRTPLAANPLFDASPAASNASSRASSPRQEARLTPLERSLAVQSAAVGRGAGGLGNEGADAPAAPINPLFAASPAGSEASSPTPSLAPQAAGGSCSDMQLATPGLPAPRAARRTAGGDEGAGSPFVVSASAALYIACHPELVSPPLSRRTSGVSNDGGSAHAPPAFSLLNSAVDSYAAGYAAPGAVTTPQLRKVLGDSPQSTSNTPPPFLGTCFTGEGLLGIVLRCVFPGTLWSPPPRSGNPCTRVVFLWIHATCFFSSRRRLRRQAVPWASLNEWRVQSADLAAAVPVEVQAVACGEPTTAAPASPEPAVDDLFSEALGIVVALASGGGDAPPCPGPDAPPSPPPPPPVAPWPEVAAAAPPPRVGPFTRMLQQPPGTPGSWLTTSADTRTASPPASTATSNPPAAPSSQLAGDRQQGGGLLVSPADDLLRTTPGSLSGSSVESPRTRHGSPCGAADCPDAGPAFRSPPSAAGGRGWPAWTVDGSWAAPASDGGHVVQPWGCGGPAGVGDPLASPAPSIWPGDSCGPSPAAGAWSISAVAGQAACSSPGAGALASGRAPRTRKAT
jgi:hypothetical protein